MSRTSGWRVSYEQEVQVLVSNIFLGTEVADKDRDAFSERFNGASEASFASAFRLIGEAVFVCGSMGGV